MANADHQGDAETAAGVGARWIVRGLWVGPELTELEWVSIASFIRHGATFELYTDDRTRRVPAGVILRDSRLLLGERIYRYGEHSAHAGSYAISGDVARLRALLELGGWWTDVDVVCLKPFAPIDSGFRFGVESPAHAPRAERTINVAVMRAPPGHEMVRLMLRRTQLPWLGSPWESPLKRLYNIWAFRHSLWDPADVPWGATGGPACLTRAVRHFALESRVLPREAFYPVHWSDWKQLPEMSDAAFHALAKQSYAVHLWCEMFRRAGVDRGRAIREAAWAQSYLTGFSER